jgi:hypothetical protein
MKLTIRQVCARVNQAKVALRDGAASSNLFSLINTSLQRGEHDLEENPGSRFNGF